MGWSWDPDSVLGSATLRWVIWGKSAHRSEFPHPHLNTGVTVSSLATASGVWRGLSGIMTMEHREHVRPYLRLCPKHHRPGLGQSLIWNVLCVLCGHGPPNPYFVREPTVGNTHSRKVRFPRTIWYHISLHKHPLIFMLIVQNSNTVWPLGFNDYLAFLKTQ